VEKVQVPCLSEGKPSGGWGTSASSIGSKTLRWKGVLLPHSPEGNPSGGMRYLYLFHQKENPPVEQGTCNLFTGRKNLQWTRCFHLIHRKEPPFDGRGTVPCSTGGFYFWLTRYKYLFSPEGFPSKRFKYLVPPEGFPSGEKGTSTLFHWSDFLPAHWEVTFSGISLCWILDLLTRSRWGFLEKRAQKGWRNFLGKVHQKDCEEPIIFIHREIAGLK
jgi:hypothetical protein